MVIYVTFHKFADGQSKILTTHGMSGINKGGPGGVPEPGALMSKMGGARSPKSKNRVEPWNIEMVNRWSYPHYRDVLDAGNGDKG